MNWLFYYDPQPDLFRNPFATILIVVPFMPATPIIPIEMGSFVGAAVMIPNAPKSHGN